MSSKPTHPDCASLGERQRLEHRAKPAGLVSAAAMRTWTQSAPTLDIEVSLL